MADGSARLGDGAPALTLYQYHGVPGVCSVDVNCIAAQAWLRMAGLTFKVNDCDTPEMASDERLPLLRTGPNAVVGASALLPYIRQHAAGGPNAKLTREQSLEHRAVWALIKERLEPLMIHALYIKNRAFFEPHWRGGLPLLVAIPVAQSRVDDILSTYCERLHGISDDELAERLDDALAALARRLQSQSFLFGGWPSEADGLLFALLVLPLAVSLPNGDLQESIRRHPSLVRHVDTVRNEFFATVR